MILSVCEICVSKKSKCFKKQEAKRQLKHIIRIH